MTLTIGSLCTGYGGLDMAVQTIWPDARLAWVADNDPGAARILGDLTQINWQSTQPVDILTAGFPCQPVSVAGRRAGTTDERWLFDDITRALRDLHPHPRLCVFENVPGLLTANHGDAMARVVQGLASVGYVGGYGVLAASDVEAPHRRERVFIVAWPADAESDTRRLADRARAHAADTDRPGRGRVGRVDPGGRDADKLGRADRHGAPGEPAPHVMLPTPKTTDGHHSSPADARRHSPGLRAVEHLLPTPSANVATNGGSQHPDKRRAGGHQPSIADVVEHLLPTPRATDGTKGGPNQRGPSGDLMLPSAVHRWGDYAPAIARWEAVIGRPAPNPTEPSEQSRKRCAVHGDPQEGRPGEKLRDMREAADAQEVRQRPAGGPQRVPATEPLLSDVREQQGSDFALGAPVSSEALPQKRVRGVRSEEPTARPPQGPQLAQRRPVKPNDAVRELPPEAPLARGQGAADGSEPMGEACSCKPRLSAKFVEFLMGLPEGHVTDPAIGLTRNQQLKALGNGVVPQQAATATRSLLNRHFPQDTP